MKINLKIVIPMAGLGSRMRPQTLSKPKALISLAGKKCLDYLIEIFHSVPDYKNSEYIFILSPNLGEQQIPLFISKHYPNLKVKYVVQNEPRGQSHAIYLARNYITGPMLVVFSDTIFSTDFSSLSEVNSDCILWVKSISDPCNSGVVEIDKKNLVTRIIEKPQSLKNNLAIAGCYYFKSGEAILSAIEEQMHHDIQFKGEYFLADAINILIERGAKVRTQFVDLWLDTGNFDSILEANHYLLEHIITLTQELPTVTIIPPVFIHETAKIDNSTIGPFVSIGANCIIIHSQIQNSIIEEGVVLGGISLRDSIIGNYANVRTHSSDIPPMRLNISDYSSIII